MKTNNKQTLRMTEKQLRNIIHESINRILNEAHLDGITWVADDDDWTIVNTNKDGNVAYGVKLWCGKGYALDLFKVYASDEEDALDKVVAYLEKNGIDKFFVDDAVEKDKEHFTDENGDVDWDAFDDEVEQYAFYVDATMDGASEPHYIYRENLFVKQFPNQ